ncbi:helix-turn-helix domain-containing protein [Micromonospora echinaurantiaca]|uniref:helix-turn-helix domain-containing protein n=1 Tax=Micromonospora echinaurantiaca TaxID=47857 RepID=UPI001E40C270|nr:transposase family protein [Micromonospora echinaurantiaca]
MPLVNGDIVDQGSSKGDVVAIVAGHGTGQRLHRIRDSPYDLVHGCGSLGIDDRYSSHGRCCDPDESSDEGAVPAGDRGLVVELAPRWQARHRDRLAARTRRRGIGAGAKHRFEFRDRLLATLVHLRHGLTHDVVADWFGVHRSTITRSSPRRGRCWRARLPGARRRDYAPSPTWRPTWATTRRR